MRVHTSEPLDRGSTCSGSGRTATASPSISCASVGCRRHRNQRHKAIGVELAGRRLPLQRTSECRICAKGAALVGSAETLDPETVAASKPTSAETARTVVAIVTHGALSTVGDDGIPLGTYASYVLEKDGQPVIRLRSSAVHTANLRREPRCSLFIQPEDSPARLLARVTLVGRVEPVQAAQVEAVREQHARLHFGGVGVDAPQADDSYYRLVVDKCFYVGGMGAACQAETIGAAEYKAAEPDHLREYASQMVKQMNSERTEDVLRIAAYTMGITLEALQGAELLWIDRLGVYLWALVAGKTQVVRVTFAREASDERDARSTLTMLAQLAWEQERNYLPVMPTLPDPVAS